MGIGAHSLRAVTHSSLGRLTDIVARDECPMHMHIAEQSAEVDQCLAGYDARPVEWLLKEFSPNDRWCLVHATHVSEDELGALCRCGAVVCLCPSTEANLGDGLFPLRAWLDQGGRVAIGSDSQITINPFEELRWLEYGQRLSSRSRNVAAVRDSHTDEVCSNRSWREAALPAVTAQDSYGQAATPISSRWMKRVRCWPVTTWIRFWMRSFSPV